MLTELITLPRGDSKRFVYEFRSPYKYTRVNICLPLYIYKETEIRKQNVCYHLVVALSILLTY